MALKWNQAELDHLLKSTAGPLGKYLGGVAARVETAAKGRCPVDTGRLRSSINWRVELHEGELCGVVATSADYARFVHDGTKYVDARPFLVDGLRAVTGSDGGWSAWSDK